MTFKHWMDRLTVAIFTLAFAVWWTTPAQGFGAGSRGGGGGSSSGASVADTDVAFTRAAANTWRVTDNGTSDALRLKAGGLISGNAVSASNVSNKALTSNVATITTDAAHNLAAGQTVTVAGVDATFNGTFLVASVPSTTTFTYDKTAGNVASTAATGTVTPIARVYIGAAPATATGDAVAAGTTITSPSTTFPALRIQKKASQTSSLMDIMDETGTYLMRVCPNGGGGLVTKGDIQLASTSSFLNWAGASQLKNIANGVVGSLDSSSAAGWIQNTAGRSRCTSDLAATSNVTLADITGMSHTLIAGRKYSFRIVLFTTSTANGGLKLAFGGTATATSIIANTITYNAATSNTPAQVTSLGALYGATVATDYAEITGTIVCNAAGTLKLQAAQNASHADTTTVKAGSYIWLEDTP